jgi:hypothetical protein
MAEDYEALEGYGEEIIGLDELVGDVVDEVLSSLEGDFDDEDDVGAIRKKLKRKIRARFVPKMSKAIKKVRSTQLRLYPIGLGVTAVPAGGQVVITLTPQLPFKPVRLSTPAVGLYIQDIQVGTSSQFAGPGAIPTACFGPAATDSTLKGDTAVPGVVIQLTITNPTLAPINMDGMLLGDVAQ